MERKSKIMKRVFPKFGSARFYFTKMKFYGII